MRRLLQRCFTVIIAFCLVSAAQSNAKDREPRVFLAGAAVSNITPPLGGVIVGGWAGIKASHIHDQLNARCIVLDDGTTRLALVVCDNLGFSRDLCDAAKRLVHEKTAISEKNILIAATHTHSAVTARSPDCFVQEKALNDYQQFIVERIADGIQTAIHNLEPAKIGWAVGDEPTQVFNRRWHLKPGAPVRNPFGGEDKVRMNPSRGSPDLLKPAGPTDPEIVFLSLQSMDGRPIALLANYSLHYVGGVEQGAVSADYFAMFADRIQELLGADRLDPPFVGIMTNGTSGDINNINFRDKSPRLAPYEKMRQVAESTAQAVFKAHQKIVLHDWVELGAEQEELKLAVRKPTKQQMDYFKMIDEKSEDATAYHSREKTYAQRVFQLHKSPDEASIPLQTLRIGDLGVAALPFEVFVEIGLELKEKGTFPQTFTVSHSNASYGYLPTVQQHALGGYETWLGTNTVEIQAAPKIVHQLLEMFKKMKDR